MRRPCPYCRGEWFERVGDRVDVYRTADASPPSEHIVRINGVVVHECERGKQLTAAPTWGAPSVTLPGTDQEL